jgi:hypothetical protein
MIALFREKDCGSSAIPPVLPALLKVTLLLTCSKGR